MSKLLRTERFEDETGTYEVTLEETSRRKLTTEDDLLPYIAHMARAAQTTVQHTGHLLLGEKDVYVAFARLFLRYIKEEPSLFDDFLEEVKQWPRKRKV